jgi:glutamate synthase domain-containing protein 2
MNSFSDYFLATVVAILLCGLLYGLYIARNDKKQQDHAILINYPLFGHFRYAFEKMGVYLRQYWFSLDNDELPFSRNTRAVIYRMAKNVKNVLSFGSTRTEREEYFNNSMFPLSKEDAEYDRILVVGKDCRTPFEQKKLIDVSAMSFGALSANAIKAISLGSAAANITQNTGEGGKPSKHHRIGFENNKDTEGGIVLQIGTANFGYNHPDGSLNYDKLAEIKNDPMIKWIQIKLSQGAKPGKGGILPGAKVSEEIAELRGVPVGEDCISPNSNPDCNTEEKLLNTIKKIKEVTGKPVGIKLAIASVDELRKLLKKGKDMKEQPFGETYLPSVITIDGGDGGTGAAPATYMESLAVKVRDIIYDVHTMLEGLNIRKDIALVGSGKLVTPHDAAVALSMGCDWVESARGFMMAIGCINALECGSGKCPVGIATQDPKLQQALVPEVKAKHVMNYAKNMEKELFDIALACGLKHPRDLTIDHLVVPARLRDESVIPTLKVG